MAREARKILRANGIRLPKAARIASKNAMSVATPS
jgi:hypothetical protein